MKQRDRHLVQMVNVSGQSVTGYFDPVPMKDIEVKVRGDYRSAAAVRSGTQIPVSHSGEYSTFVVPTLTEYEIVELR
jgi:hypothetical protein